MKLGVSLIIGWSVALQALAGGTVTFVIRNEGAGAGSEKPTVMRIKVEGDGAKVEWVEGRSTMGSGKNGYMVTKDAGKTLYMVNPEDKNYFNVAGMAQMAAGMMSVKVTDCKVEKLLDEAGPVMLGYPTRHYKFAVAHSMEMSFMGRKQTSSSKSEQDIWVATKADLQVFSVLEKISSKIMGGMVDLQKAIDAERSKFVKGLPLKTVTVSDSGTPGRPNKTTNVMEITEIKEGSLAASEFEIPKGYEEVTMDGPKGKGRDTGGEEAASEDEGKDAGREAAKPTRRPPVPVDSMIRRFAPGR